MSIVAISDLARELGIPPRRISDLMYAETIDASDWPRVAGRRVIPRNRVPEIVSVLKERGVLRHEEEIAAS